MGLGVTTPERHLIALVRWYCKVAHIPIDRCSTPSRFGINESKSTITQLPIFRNYLDVHHPCVVGVLLSLRLVVEDLWRSAVLRPRHDDAPQGSASLEFELKIFSLAMLWSFQQ